MGQFTNDAGARSSETISFMKRELQKGSQNFHLSAEDAAALVSTWENKGWIETGELRMALEDSYRIIKKALKVKEPYEGPHLDALIKGYEIDGKVSDARDKALKEVEDLLRKQAEEFASDDFLNAATDVWKMRKPNG